MPEPTYRIKPLEWKQWYNFEDWTAQTSLGAYRVVRLNTQPGYVWTTPFSSEGGIELSFNAAKASAEADYRGRLMLALEVVDE